MRNLSTIDGLPTVQFQVGLQCRQVDDARRTQCIHDPLRCATVTIGAGSSGHRLIDIDVVEQSTCPDQQEIGVCTHQFCRAGMNAFRALSTFAKDKYRLPEASRFLLEAARICDDE